MSTSEAATFELLQLTVEVNEDRTIYRNSEGELHRLFGPAVLYTYGHGYWYWRNMYHRVGGPTTARGTHYIFNVTFPTKEAYELECLNKTLPQWKEYDAELQQYA